MTPSILFISICASSLLASMLGLQKRTHIPALLAVLVLFAVLQLPIKGLPISGYLLGIVSDLSITTLLVSVLSLIALVNKKPLYNDRQYLSLWIAVPVIALLFYPPSLGLSYFDPYQSGYQPKVLLMILLVCAIALWWTKQFLLLTILLLDLWSYYFELLPSNNLWDYLIDPILVIYCITQLILTNKNTRVSAPDC